MAQMKSKKPITASLSTNSILGTYEGESMDTTITNKNGLDITSEVIDVVLSSDDYEQGIANGWFIGFLGHPEDPNCMEFERGCIVLRSMRKESNGKVYCTFDLINTPVGQIVKTFIDAGVKFGISIRGAGDIIGNSVDPETFVFRGYDLVSFPAYPESIPTFTAVAASTDLETRKKYQAVCAAVKANCSKIMDCNTLDLIQTQFAPQSDEYSMLNDRKQELSQCDNCDDLSDVKVEAMTQLYLKACDEIRMLTKELESAKIRESKVLSATKRKIAALERVTCAQQQDAKNSLAAITVNCNAQKRKSADLSDRLKSLKSDNLIYQQKVNASAKTEKDKDRVIASLQSQLRETVTASKQIETRTSNLDGNISRLKSDKSKLAALLSSYQNAYASLYATALGVDPASIAITATTSVKELQTAISSATNTCNMPSTVLVEPAAIVNPDDDEDDLITM